MTALTIDLPRKSSRTRTKAVIVPRTALINVTTAAAPSVSFSAATASGSVTAFQNVSAPCLRDSQITAAIGSVTTIVRKVVTKPKETAVCALSLEARGRAATTEAALASRPSDCLLDPDHQALARVEPALLRGAPTSEHRVADRDEALERVLRLDLCRRHLVDGAEPVLREDLLCCFVFQVADELDRLLAVLGVLRDRDRQLDQHRAIRDEVREALARLLRSDRLAL